MLREEDECFEEILDQFSDSFGYQEDLYEDDAMMEEMMMFLSSPELLRETPDELLMSISPLLFGFPADVQQMVEKELKRRHLLQGRQISK